MEIRIFRAAKSAMQSGRGRTGRWIAEFAPAAPMLNEPLMGWPVMSDTRRQLRLEFDSSEDAIAWARAQGVPYIVSETGGADAKVDAPPRSYEDNFRTDRLLRWTH